MKAFRQVAAWVIAAASLWWVARDLDAAVLRDQWLHLNWYLVTAAIGLDVLSYLIQGFRWSAVLRPAGCLSPFKATQAIYIGLFANEILPLRVGEVIRTYVAARWLRISAIAVLPSLVIERMLDALWLTLAVIIAAQIIPFPGLVAKAAHLLYLGVGALVLLLPVLFWGADRLPRLSFLEALFAGLRSFGFGRRTATAMLWSFGLLSAQCVSFWTAMRSCGLHYPLWVGCAALVIVRLGTVVPAAPANAGTYQLFCTLALKIFGVQSGLAASFSILVFVMLTLPL